MTAIEFHGGPLDGKLTAYPWEAIRPHLHGAGPISIPGREGATTVVHQYQLAGHHETEDVIDADYIGTAD